MFKVVLLWAFKADKVKRHFTAEHIVRAKSADEAILKAVFAARFDKDVSDIRGRAKLVGDVETVSSSRRTKFDKWDGYEPSDFMGVPNP